MEIVAIHLAEEALRIVDQADRDLFGRSAFNRFYYATYLTVRAALSAEVGDFPHGHSSVPEYLLGTVRRGLKQGEQRARKVQDSDLAKACSRAWSSTKDLAELLREGYSVRVTADYRPDVLVTFDGGDFGLNTVRASDARSWQPKAAAMCRSICSAWKQAQHA